MFEFNKIFDDANFFFNWSNENEEEKHISNNKSEDSSEDSIKSELDYILNLNYNTINNKNKDQ